MDDDILLADVKEIFDNIQELWKNKDRVVAHAEHFSINGHEITIASLKTFDSIFVYETIVEDFRFCHAGIVVDHASTEKQAVEKVLIWKKIILMDRPTILIDVGEGSVARLLDKVNESREWRTFNMMEEIPFQ